MLVAFAAATSASAASTHELDKQIGSLEAQLSNLYSMRMILQRSPTVRKHAVIESSCDFPPAYNFSNLKGKDDKLTVPWCEPDSKHPTSRSLEDLSREGQGGPIAVLPSLLVPCCAHSGTTFLWRCMNYAYHPQRVCGRTSAPKKRQKGRFTPERQVLALRHEEWTASKCEGKRYLLPGLAGNIEGHWDYRKEWFFYGGGANSWTKGWQDYTGVPLPLCYWEPEFLRLLREQPLDDTLAQSRRLCTARGPSTFASSVIPVTGTSEGLRPTATPESACTHRACIPLDLHKVRLSPAYAGEYDSTKPRWQIQVGTTPLALLHCQR